MSKQRVTFRFSDLGAGSGFGYGSVPNLSVEVHEETLALAARGTLGGGVSEPGRGYFISVTLPAAPASPPMPRLKRTPRRSNLPILLRRSPIAWLRVGTEPARSV